MWLCECNVSYSFSSLEIQLATFDIRKEISVQKCTVSLYRSVMNDQRLTANNYFRIKTIAAPVQACLIILQHPRLQLHIDSVSILSK